MVRVMLLLSRMSEIESLYKAGIATLHLTLRVQYLVEFHFHRINVAHSRKMLHLP